VQAESLRFEVPVTPVPKARPRIVNGHAYTPRRTSDFERAVAACALEARARAGWDMLEGPVTVDMTFVRLRANADVDNAVKAVLDAVRGVLFRDDRQVVGVAAWIERAGPPGVIVEVMPL